MADESWSKEHDWFWEGNVQAKIVEHMKKEGFAIVRQASTLRKERGPDIVGNKGMVKRIVAVKGYPSDKYVSGFRKGKKKPTNPILQARHWFAEALLEVILAKSESSDIEIAIGLPKFARYVNLFNRVLWFSKSIGLYLYLVDADNAVSVIKPGETAQM